MREFELKHGAWRRYDLGSANEPCDVTADDADEGEYVVNRFIPE